MFELPCTLFRFLHQGLLATEYYNSVIGKAIRCGDPQFGYVDYRCLNCGGGILRSGFACKTKFCIHCARKSSNDFIEERMDKLYPGVVYRHLILTIPEQLRVFFYRHRFTGKNTCLHFMF
ncbi:MAG: transposase zinc-binding domain-containing protein [Oligoflexia bacterium]|nr:transposase zinc-binding domain-containing protein [Oligoflexia bacterium]